MEAHELEFVIRMQVLGADKQSFGYGGTGKKATGNKFEDYGSTHEGATGSGTYEQGPIHGTVETNGVGMRSSCNLVAK